MRVRLAFATALLISGVITLSLAISFGEAAGRQGGGPTPQMQRVTDSRAQVHGYLKHGQGRTVKVRGWVSVVHVDDGSKGGHWAYVLHTSDTKSYTLDVDAATIAGAGASADASGTKFAPGQIVEATATANGTALTVSAATVTGQTAQYAPSPSQTPVAETNRKVLVIPVTFLDSPTLGVTPAAIDAAYNVDVRNYYLESSAQKLTLTTTVMPTIALQINGAGGASRCDYSRYSDAAKIEAAKTQTLSNYEHISLVFPDQQCGWAGLGEVGAGQTWIPVSSMISSSVLTHELGHNLGMAHSNVMTCTADEHVTSLSADCDTVEYADSSDTMSNYSWHLLNGFHRAQLGFLPLENTKTVDPSVDATYSLSDVEDVKAAGTTQLLRVPRAKALARPGRSNEQYFYVDLRKPIPGDTFDNFAANDPAVTGVSVRTGGDYSVNGSPMAAVLPNLGHDPYPSSPNQRGDRGWNPDLSLHVGQSLYDPYQNLTITNVATASGSASVRVAPGAPRGAATSVAVVGGQLQIRGGSGAVNAVILSATSTDVIVTDTGSALGLGGGCTAINAISAKCPKSTVTSIDVDTGDRDDTIGIMSGLSTPTTLRGGPGDDDIGGGDGADVIDGGTGADLIEGNGGIDTITYASRTAPITFTNATTGNDGEAGEHDRIRTDVENVIGGSGADTITTPEPVSHVITGGLGADSIIGGPANDTIYARDGVKDTKLDCGASTDTVFYDNTVESPVNCSTNTWVAQAAILAGPAAGGFTAATAPQFTLTANSTTATIQCKLESGAAPGAAAFGSCGAAGATIAASTVWTAPVQTAGVKTLSVRAMSGTTQQGTIVTRTFTIDTAAPDTTLTSYPTPGSKGPSATFVVTTSEPGAGLQCALDTATFTACTSPVAYDNLTDGAHTFSARAIDQAGNVDATPAPFTWTVDSTPPDTTITSGPSGATTDPTPDFAFTGTPSADTASFECRITEVGATAAVPFAPCSGQGAATGTHTGAALDDGSYLFEVRAVDSAGNRDATPASRPFVLAQGGATVTLTTIGGVPTVTVTGGAGRRDNIVIATFGTTTNIVAGAPIVGTGACVTRATGTSVGCTGAVGMIAVNTGSGNDTVHVYGAVPTTVDGGSGDDLVLLGESTADDQVIGGPGTDTASYEAETSPVTASLDGVANDGANGEHDNIGTDVETLLGGSGNDTLTGGAALATLRGGAGDDIVEAGSGGADLDGGTGSDQLKGGAGIDTADYSLRTEPMAIALTNDFRSGSLVDTSENDLIDDTVENALGSSETDPTSGDYFIDNALNNVYRAGTNAGTGGNTDWLPYGGDDTVYGGTDGDWILDGPGDDAYYGNAGNDSMNDGPGADLYFGGTGDDALTSEASSADRDVFSGGTGIDTVSYENKTAAVTANLSVSFSNGTPGEDDFIGADIENLKGSPFADTLNGNGDDNRIEGGAGDDVIDGGAGQDALFGQDGTDTVSYATRAAAITLRVSFDPWGTVQLFGGQGQEDDTAQTFEKVALGSGNDTVSWAGRPEPITIDGGAGSDTLTGGNGADTILAQNSDLDTVDCGPGIDHASLDATDTATACEPRVLEIGAPAAPALPPARVSLSSDPVLGASLDWVHWNGTTAAVLQRKAGTPQIAGWTKNGSAATSTSTGSAIYSWTNAATAPAAAESGIGVGTGASNGRGFRFTVPALGSAPRTLKVYVGVSGAASGQLKTWFTGDPTATTPLGVPVVSTSTVVDRVITVKYQPARPTDTLNVDWSQLTGGTASTARVVLYGAAIY